MSNYHPTSRRPIAGLFRKTADLAVHLCVRLKIHPDAISYSSILAAAGAGVCFWQAESLPLWWLWGSLLCMLRLWFNMLDGMVALASDKASLRGEIVNDLPDRLSDVLIFVGIAHSGLCHLASGYWVALLALATAYVGTLGQAVGVGRQFGGWMSKPWRMVTLIVGVCVTVAAARETGDEVRIAGLTLLDLTCLLIVLGCVQTIVARLVTIVRNLDEQEGAADVARDDF